MFFLENYLLDYATRALRQARSGRPAPLRSEQTYNIGAPQ
jgi:hypothetical protein